MCLKTPRGQVRATCPLIFSVKNIDKIVLQLKNLCKFEHQK